MATAAAPFVSIVIVNWNSKDDLRGCLRSLDRQTGVDADPSFETIVVDNGSTDGSIELVRTEFPGVKLIEAGANLGFAEGCNRGIAVARGAWIFTLNNDTEVDPRCLAELAKAARSADADVGSIQAHLCLRDAPHLSNSTGIVIFPDGYAEDRAFGAPVRANEVADEIFCPTAGAALYRRSMLDATRLSTGWFDRRYFMYFEDVDLGWRARLAGWRSIYWPTALVFHAFQGSSNRHGKNFVGIMRRKNRIRTMLKNGSFRYVARGAPRSIADLCELVWWTRGRGVVDAVRAIGGGVLMRREVNRMLRSNRRAIEKRWITAPPKKTKTTTDVGVATSASTAPSSAHQPS